MPGSLAVLTRSSQSAWSGEHIPPKHSLSSLASSSVSGCCRVTLDLLTQIRQSDLAVHAAMLLSSPGQRPACWLGSDNQRMSKTLENHSGADTRTEAKLLVLGFNFTRMLPVTHIKYGSFCENAHAAEHQHFLKLDYKRITFLTKIFL